MRARFANNEYADPMLELVSLKQTTYVEEYYEEFEALLNLLHLPDDYALSIFVSNLKSDLSKSVRLFYPKDLTHALNLAKQMESAVYNLPRKSFLPYKSITTPNMNPYPSQTTFKNNTTMNQNTLPALLPTPKIPALPKPIQNIPSQH